MRLLLSQEPSMQSPHHLKGAALQLACIFCEPHSWLLATHETEQAGANILGRSQLPGCCPCRKLSKKVQTSLADANGVADEVLASMTTVKAHAAEASANKTYADRLHNFYILQVGLAASRRQHLPAHGSTQAYSSTCKPVEAAACPWQHASLWQHLQACRGSCMSMAARKPMAAPASL